MEVLSADRFIPSRSAMDLEISHYNLMKENVNSNFLGENAECKQYNERLAESLFNGKMASSKVLAFKDKAPAPKEGSQNPHKVLYSCNSNQATSKKTKVNRYIPQNAERVLDAPNYSNDYYLNLIDWSSNNTLAIALGSAVYLWNAGSGSTVELMKSADNSDLTSVQWTKEGQHLAIGKMDGSVELWDAINAKPLRVLRGHSARVGSLAWNNHVLSSGSKDTNIIHHDVRIQNHVTMTLQNHTQEICGLKWSDDGLQLASGGNDNVVNIWNVNQNRPKFTFTEHIAAVKALAWCPWQKDLLATGGGSADRCIKFWNTNTGAMMNSIDTESQVSSLIWSPNGSKEIVSSHGFSQNQVVVWKYPSLVKVAELRGHSDRILQMAASPDGKTIVSAAADETLRFWRIFEELEAEKCANAKTVKQTNNWTTNVR